MSAFDRLHRSLLGSAGGLLALLATASTAVADPPRKNPGEFPIEGRLEPADLAPGASGFLVVTARIHPGHHVYSDDNEAVRWRPIDASGVTYRVPPYDAAKGGISWADWKAKPEGVEWTPAPHVYKDEWDQEMSVWEAPASFSIKIPVTLGANAVPGTELVILLSSSACSKEMCYQRVKNQRVVVTLGAKPEPAPSPPVPSAPGGGPRLFHRASSLA